MSGYLSLEEVLAGGGHRVTAPRRAVWTVLLETGEHLTADEIADRVRTFDPNVNLSSIYRSLSLFAELGLVRESSLDSGVVHWEKAHPDDHFHLRCRSCGRVDHHEGEMVDQIRRHLAGEHGFRTEQVDLVVSGLCSDCNDSQL